MTVAVGKVWMSPLLTTLAFYPLLLPNMLGGSNYKLLQNKGKLPCEKSGSPHIHARVVANNRVT